MYALKSGAKDPFRRNIRLFFAYQFFTLFIPIGPVFTLFLQSKGLNCTQTLILFGVLSAFQIAFIIPAGLIADRVSRRSCLIACGVMRLISQSFYLFGSHYYLFLIAEAFFGISFALEIGIASAYLYEYLKHHRAGRLYPALEAGSTSYRMLGMAFSGMSCALLMRYGYDFLNWISFFTFMFAPLFCLGLLETAKPDQAKHHVSLRDTVISAYREIRRKPVVLLMMALMTCTGVLVCFTFNFWQLRLKAGGVPIASIGIIAACFQLISSTSARTMSRLLERLGEWRLLGVMQALLITVFIGLATSASWPILIVFLALFQIMLGIGLPLNMAILNKRVGSINRSTTQSFGSFIQNGLYILAIPGMGYVADHISVATVFQIMIIPMILLNVPLFLLIGRRLNRESAKPVLQSETT